MFKKLRIGTKLSLLLMAIFLVGIVISGLVLFRALDRRAQSEVTTRGLLMLETMNGVRAYTSQHINPMLQDELESEEAFVSESVPAFSARTVFENFAKNEEYANFHYKEATLNPTNPDDKADDWETSIVEQFRADDSLNELTGYRERNGERVFYIARPLRVGAESCLRCHSEPSAAPASLVNTYGTEGGFGWQLNEIVAAQIVYVPADEVFESARLSFIWVIAIFVGVFAVVLLALNLMMRPMVVRPIRELSNLSERLADEEITEDDMQAVNQSTVNNREDEFGQLGRVFRKMAQEVYKREQNLKRQVQELKIEIDLVRQTQQVEEITDTEYFQNLQKRAKELRKTDDSPYVPPPMS